MVTSENSENLRDSKSGSMKHTHLIGCEDPRSQDHKEIVQDKLEGFSEAKNVMDCDRPELIVFLQNDRQKFVTDICTDRRVSTKGECLLEHCDLVHSRICPFDPNAKGNSDSNVETLVTVSSSSKGSECAPEHPCVKDSVEKHGFRNLSMELEGEMELDSGHKNSTDHPTKKLTAETLREAFNKETEFSRSFKNWQMNSFLGTADSGTEFPHCADCQQFPEATSMSTGEIGNSQSLTGSDKRLDGQEDYPGGTSSFAVGSLSAPTSHTVPATKSGSAYHQSNDSISSTNSFAFPVLPSEWNGSPVRMLETDRRSRKHQWWKICFTCCKRCSSNREG